MKKIILTLMLSIFLLSFVASAIYNTPGYVQECDCPDQITCPEPIVCEEVEEKGNFSRIVVLIMAFLAGILAENSIGLRKKILRFNIKLRKKKVKPKIIEPKIDEYDKIVKGAIEASKTKSQQEKCGDKLTPKHSPGETPEEGRSSKETERATVDIPNKDEELYLLAKEAGLKKEVEKLVKGGKN